VENYSQILMMYSDEINRTEFRLIICMLIMIRNFLF